MRVLVLLGMFAGGRLVAAEHVETLYPGKGLTVVARELANEVEFKVDSPNPTSMAIQVDRNHNGKVDGSVDVAYSRQADGKPCFVHLLGTGRHAISPCGRFPSAAKLVPNSAKGKSGYTLTVPKKELTLTGNSVSLTFWVMMKDGNSWKSLFYPSEFFEKPIEFRFTQK